MDQIKEQLKNSLQKIKMLEDFIALSLRREKVAGDVHQIVAEAERMRKLMVSAHDLLQNELAHAQNESEKIMRRMRGQQKIILDHVINERRQKLMEPEKDEEKVQSVLTTNATCNADNKTVPSSVTKMLGANFSRMNLSQCAITPKMSIIDYKASPLVKRTKVHPIPFSFLEFEVHITPEQFDSIPKYMRGRETLDELNNFLETVIIPCFNEKYKLLHKVRSSVRPNDLEMWKLYNEQATYLLGRNFITPGDISRRINKMLDKKLLNRIVMLRHINILQEQRISQTICYIWTANPM